MVKNWKKKHFQRKIFFIHFWKKERKKKHLSQFCFDWGRDKFKPAKTNESHHFFQKFEFVKNNMTWTCRAEHFIQGNIFESSFFILRNRTWKKSIWGSFRHCDYENLIDTIGNDIFVNFIKHLILVKTQSYLEQRL